MKLLVTEHAPRAGTLPGPHRDPFDRMLIAQSRFESLPIISADAVFAGYGIDVVWNS
jgi:PIN domain nuclease of toxin-antitoxin system